MGYSNEMRLDASESIWFENELRSVDQRQYMVVNPPSKARQLLPTQGGIPDWAAVYEWRMFQEYGEAQYLADGANDFQRVDVKGDKSTKLIKPVGASYGYNLMEIRAARATGRQLDEMKAAAARQAVEQKIDSILALGDSAHNLEGLLNITSAPTYTLATKAAGGLTWAVATSDEIVADINGMVNARFTANKDALQFEKYTMVMPFAQYALIASKRMGDGSDMTVLKFVQANNPYLGEVIPWHRCAGAGAGDTDRIVVYPKTPLVIAAIVPMEYTVLPMKNDGWNFTVPVMATTGGVVCRYLHAVAYADGS